MITITINSVQNAPLPSVFPPVLSPTGITPTDPLPTSGLVVHLDGDTGVSTSTGVVNGWADQSGFGNHVSSIGNPTLHAGALNGHDVIRLDGRSDRFSRKLALNGIPGSNKARSIFLVARYDETIFSGMAATGEGWLLQEIIHDGTGLKHYKNGTLVDSQAHNCRIDLTKADLTKGKGLLIGAELDRNPYVAMYIAALLVYDYALADAERQQVEAYLQTKYL
ncbi:MAG: hypothetical protein AAF716_02845 [Cyanobacteria bacterium P01_D01_bin.1]